MTPHAHNFEDFLVNMITADDEYYLLIHYNEITNAFANHEIYLPWASPQNSNTINNQLQTIANNNVDNVIDIPNSTNLITNYPNPFNPTTTIKYQLKDNGFVSLKIYDVLGKEIEELVNENKSAGFYNATFNASNLTSGLYFYRLSVNGFVETKKMLLTK